MPPTYNGPGAGGERAEAGTGIIAERRYRPNIIARSQAPADQRDLRFRHGVARLHALGPRAVYELLAELGAKRLLRTEIEALVGYYADLDPERVRAFGAGQLPPLPPLRLVER